MLKLFAVMTQWLENITCYVPSILSVYTENGTTKNVVYPEAVKDLLHACNH